MIPITPTKYFDKYIFILDIGKDNIIPIVLFSISADIWEDAYDIVKNRSITKRNNDKYSVERKFSNVKLKRLDIPKEFNNTGGRDLISFIYTRDSFEREGYIDT